VINRIPLLVGLLAIQVLLIGLVSLGSGSDESVEHFLSFDPDAVSALTISDAEGGSVKLSRTGSGWRIDDTLPADATRIAEAIESLMTGTATWPVATSTSSQTRFEVTEEGFQRRLEFRADDTVLADVYLGTSPGFRRVHARSADEDAVYSIDFAVHEVPAEVDEWLDKNLLQTGEISLVALADGSRLARADGGEGWLIDGQAADREAAQKVIDRIEGLSVLGLSEGAAVNLGQARTVSVVDAEGNHELTFRHNEEQDEYVLASDRWERDFVVASYIVEQILVEAGDLAVVEEVPPVDDSGI